MLRIAITSAVLLALLAACATPPVRCTGHIVAINAVPRDTPAAAEPAPGPAAREVKP